jgi:membrane fusion protein, multidrug efflux system
MKYGGLNRIRRLGIFLGLIVIGVIAVVGGQVGRQTSPGGGDPGGGQAAVPVTAALAIRQDVPNLINTIGTVQSIDLVAIQAQASGPIVKIEFQLGQDVKKGQELFLIDPRPYQAALDAAKAQLAHDQAALGEAQTDLERYQKLAHENSIAMETYQDQVFVVEQDKESLALDQANIDTAQINLGYCHIKSPIDGRAGILLIELGNIVGPVSSAASTSSATSSSSASSSSNVSTMSTTSSGALQTSPTTPTTATPAAPATIAAGANQTGELVSISQMKPIYVNFPVPQTLFDEVQKNQAAGPLEVDAYSQAGKLIGKGKLTVVDNQVNSASGTITMQATFANDDEALWPGEFVRVELTVATQRDVVTVPAQAVMVGPSGSYVYVIGADQTVHRVDVEAAAEVHGIDVIEKGIDAGDKVVVDGQYRLANGVKVNVEKVEKTAETGVASR